MTVLHLLGADEDTGGILSVIRNLQNSTAGQGCTHAVLVNSSYKETRKPSLSYRHSRYLLAESPSHFALFARAMATIPGLLRLLKREPVDVVHAHSRGAFPLACLLAMSGRSVVFTNHAYARRTGMYRKALRLRHFHMVCLTPNMARHYGMALDSDRLHIISACCADRFFELPLVERRAAASDRPVVRLVGIGNIVRWKNWHLVLEALGLLDKTDRARFEFHHWGPVSSDADSQLYRSELDETVRKLGLGEQCRFHGQLQDVEKALSGADCFVIPSTNEPCSVALIEALAMGVPAIASASGGNVDIVYAERTGLLFEPESAVSLAECFKLVLRNQVEFGDGKALRESVRERCASSVGAKYLVLYGRLLKPRAQGPLAGIVL